MFSIKNSNVGPERTGMIEKRIEDQMENQIENGVLQEL